MRFIYKDQLYNIPHTLSKTMAMIPVAAEPFGTLSGFKATSKQSSPSLGPRLIQVRNYS